MVMVGNTLSHYTIVAELGRGGMGVVYKAEDTKLGRTVALKLLPTFASVSEQDKSRFQHEARAAAAINHSRIATIYDFGETEDGQPYLVMEYIKGETLSDIIGEGPLKIERAVAIAIQTAEGLQVAHEAGVVHRDIKSSNIMLTERGEVKIMDFGLAKMESASKLTRDGTTLGTIAYMSPEQARAERVDLRSDLWSLGVVLYEMISGRTPFEGTYEQAIIYTILNLDHEPLTGVRTGVPLELEWVVNKCLSKDAARRYQHADDLITDLRAVDVTELSASGHRSKTLISSPSVSTEVSSWKPRLVWPILAMVILTAVAIGWAMRPGGDAVPLMVTGTELLSVEDELVRFPDLHPGGDIVAYTKVSDGVERIYYRQLSGGTPQRLLNTFDGDQRFPKYAPDGQTLIFTSNGTLFSVEALGGVPRPLAARQSDEGAAFTNPAWSPDGTQIAFTAMVRTNMSTGMNSVYVLDVKTRTRSVVSIIRDVHSPSWSPDGTRLAVVSGNSQFLSDDRNIASSSIWIVPVDGEPPIQVTNDDHSNLSPVWKPDGSGILFVSDRGGTASTDIWNLPIGPSGEAAGDAIKVYSSGRRLRSIALSQRGNMLLAEEIRNKQNIWSSPIRQGVVASARDATAITRGDQQIESVIVSPDQSQIAFDSNIGGGSKIFVMSVQGGEARQVTFDDGQDFVYSWSPDGTQLAFHSLRNGIRDIFSVRLSDGVVSEVIVDSTRKNHPRWSADGSMIGFTRQGNDARDFALVHRLADGTWGQEVTLVHDSLGTAGMNPVKNQLAFNTYRNRLYTTELDQFVPELILENPYGVWWPVWSPDGKSIYFTDNRMTWGGGIWSVPSLGGEPTEVLLMDGRRLGKGYFGVSENALFYVLRETETDIWKYYLSGLEEE